MVPLIYFIIYLSNIICIICINNQNNSFITILIQKLFPQRKYNKLVKKYNINIQITENKKVTNEFFVNTSYISKDYPFDFLYTGKLFYLNNTNLDLLYSNNHNYQWILLIKSNDTFENYVFHNKSLISSLTKAIIIPKNLINNIDESSKHCFKNLSIYLIEIEEYLFNKLANQYIAQDNNVNYLVKIISKKYETFPYIGLYSIILYVLLLLFIFSMFYKYLIKKYENSLKIKHILFLKNIQNCLDEKIYILFLLFMDLYFFYNLEGFIYDYTSFIKFFTIIFMIINKSRMINLILNIFYGIGLINKESNIFTIFNFYLTSLITLFYTLFQIFISPLRILYAYYIINIIIYIPIYSVILFYSIKNIIFFCKINSKIRKKQRYNDKYGRAIRLKICILYSQFIIYFIYIFFFFVIHKYLLFKNGFIFEIEKDILFQCLESCLLLLISLIYIPRKWPIGFEYNILLIKDTIKSNKVQLFDEYNYHSNIPKENLSNEIEVKNFVRSNYQKHFTILNPKVFLRKNNDNNNNILENNIKIGKIYHNLN